MAAAAVAPAMTDRDSSSHHHRRYPSSSVERSSSRGSRGAGAGAGMTRSTGSMTLSTSAGVEPLASTSMATATARRGRQHSAPSPTPTPESPPPPLRRLPHSSSTTSDNFVLVDAPPPPPPHPLRRIERSVLSDGGAEADAESAVEMSASPSAASSSAHPPRETHTVRRTREGDLRKINQYLRLELLGAGSHGRVWLCRDTSLPERHPDEFCALKEVMREGTKADQRYQGLRANKQRVNIMHSSSARSHHRRDEDLGSDTLAPSSAKHAMDTKVRTEIAVMKRCHHKHIVKLREVINDSRVKKVFFILEYMSGGQVVWQNPSVMPPMPTLTVAEARSVFRDLVLGLEYLHHQGIIHRDIKPGNLLWETPERRTVKISDFGVSVVMQHTLPLASPSGSVRPASTPSVDENTALRSSNGTFAFFAPELCMTELTPATTPMARGPHRNDSYGMWPTRPDDEAEDEGEETIQTPPTPPSPTDPRRRIISRPLDPEASRRLAVGYGIDVWAAGVTLYCLLFGDVPFRVDGQFSYFGIIPVQSIEVPELMGAERTPTEGSPAIDLLDRLLEKDPSKRASLEEVKRHPWLLQGLDIDSTDWLKQTAAANEPKVVVSQDDVAQATAMRTHRTKSSGRTLAVALKRAMDRFGVFGRSSPSTLPDEGADSVMPLSPRSSMRLAGARSRAHSSAAVSSSSASASVPLSPVTPADGSSQASPLMQRTISGSSAGSHSPAINRVPSQALRPAGHLQPPDGRRTSWSERGGGGASESDVVPSSPVTKSPGAFKTLIGRMRSSSRVGRTAPPSPVVQPTPQLRQLAESEPEPPTPTPTPRTATATIEPDSAPAYSSRALKPVIFAAAAAANSSPGGGGGHDPSYSSDEFDSDSLEEDEDEGDGEDDERDEVAAMPPQSPASARFGSPDDATLPNSRFPPSHAHHGGGGGRVYHSSDLDGAIEADAEEDDQDSDEDADADDSFALDFSRTRSRAERRS